MTTFLIQKQVYSEKAGRLHGNPFVWPVVAKLRQAPPRDQSSFHKWLWDLVSKFGAGTYYVSRTQCKGERRGFHPVFYGYVDGEIVTVERRYPQFKSHAGLPSSRQLYYKGVTERSKFRKRRR